ncbi:MAG: hypothetical protein CMM87_03055 [Rickettsiales bacterium]|nr:hypothetical protein [Rickettsiales bacterium]|tara:strand:- start:1868 stop:2668 length:801 start_codon:yes stop_codon:yes gene_type:complete
MKFFIFILSLTLSSTTLNCAPPVNPPFQRGTFTLDMKTMNASQVRRALTENRSMKSLIIKNYNHDVFISTLQNNPNMRFNNLKSFTLRNGPKQNEFQPFYEEGPNFFKELDQEFFSKAPHVESLDLSGTQGHYVLANAIAFSTNLKNLKSLTLVNCGIPKSGVDAINVGLKKLTSLNLASNNLGLGGVRTALHFYPKEKSTLKSLNLTDNALNKDMASQITYDLTETGQRNPKVANLNTFYLSEGNSFTRRQLQKIKNAYRNVLIY